MTELPQAPKWIDEPGNLAFAVLLQGMVGVAAGLAIWWATGRDVFGFVTWQWEDLIVAAIATGTLIPVMQSIVAAFPDFLRWAVDQQRMLFAHGRRYSRWQILVISVGAGVGEEALFRGGVQTSLSDYFPAWAAILAVSLIFAAFHLGSRGVFAFIFATSLIFSVIFHFTGSLLGAMITHTLFDVWALTVVQRELVRRGELPPSK
jgi:membrane protease YdiL (CAAX protease family)